MLQRYVTVDGHRTRYLQCGSSGDFLVLLHGLGASAERWEFVIPLFEKHFRVIVPDLIGFGYSDKPSVDYTIDFFTDFLDGLLTELGIRRPHVIGSSMGGQISAEFAARDSSRIKKLVLVSPSGTMSSPTPALDSYIMAALYPSIESAKRAFEEMDAGRARVPDHIVEDFVKRMKLPNAKMAYMSTLLGLRSSADIRSKLGKIATPTLLVWGGFDRVIPQKHSEAFVSGIPNCAFLSMQESGHTPYVDDPHSFYGHVVRFLTGRG